MKASKLVLAVIAMLIVLGTWVAIACIYTKAPKPDLNAWSDQDTMSKSDREALLAFPLYTPVSMPY